MLLVCCVTLGGDVWIWGYREWSVPHKTNQLCGLVGRAFVPIAEGRWYDPGSGQIKV